jgi:hypothetical protein
MASTLLRGDSMNVLSGTRRLRRLAADVAPLRASRDFRLLFASRTVTLFGSQATEVALLVQARRLTGSATAVGLLGAAELLPLVVFGLYGGSSPTGGTAGG